MKNYFSLSMTIAALLIATQLQAKPEIPEQGSNSEQLTQAVWQEQDVNFWYLGTNTHYSCRALEQKIETLLLHFGAKENPTVRAHNCSENVFRSSKLRNLSQAVSVSLNFHVPVEDKTAVDSSGSFSAQVKSVSVSNLRPRRIESFDCELIDNFAIQVLPKFDQEIVKKTTTCFRRQSTLHAWRLESNILVHSSS